MNDLKFVYFGGEPLGVPVLEELKTAGFLPSLVVASPDRPSGRGQKLTPPPVKVWAESNNIATFQPDTLKDKTGVKPLFQEKWDLFIVVAYNKILPEWLIELPKHKTLNVHPSLLPLLRGASPIRSAILKDMRDQIGVSVMVLDKKMDHGPTVTQEQFDISSTEWPIRGTKLDEVLAHMGGRLLAATLPGYLSGDIIPQEQEHEYATYCGQFEKSEGELTVDPYQLPTGDEAYQMLLKIYAFMGTPGTYFIHEGKRFKVADAELSPGGQLRITRIIPEGKPEMDFADRF